MFDKNYCCSVSNNAAEWCPFSPRINYTVVVNRAHRLSVTRYVIMSIELHLAG